MLHTTFGQPAAARLYLGSFRALETRLLDLLSRMGAGDGVCRATVVVPSSLLAMSLKARAAARFGRGLLGVRFATLFQFALDLAAGAAQTDPPATLLLERLVLEWQLANGAAAPSPPPGYGHAAALLAAIRDLKEAGVAPEPEPVLSRLREIAASAAADDETTALSSLDLRRLALVWSAYRGYEDGLARTGLLDRASVFAGAHWPEGRARETVVVYGFYDMTQGQAGFLSRLAGQVDLTLLLPEGEEGRGWTFGRWLRDLWAREMTGATERLPDAAPPRPAIVSAAGERDEIWHCAKEIRRLLDSGCPATEILLLARTIEPYEPHVAQLFSENCIPYWLPYGERLLDHPLAKAARLLLHLEEQDHPRSSLLEVVLHPLFPGAADRRHWDLATRALHIERGSDWDRLEALVSTGTSFAAADERSDSIRTRIAPEAFAGLLAAVRRVRASPTPARAAWSAHAHAFAEALGRAFPHATAEPHERTVLSQLAAVLSTLASLDALGGPVSRRDFLAAFERECGRSRLPAEPNLGVLVSDVVAARGLSARHVFVVGANARTFPRFLVEEPFLTDAVRREVLGVLGHALPLRSEGYDEERLLFTLAGGSATERFVCVYQRADAEGRMRDPSPYLREFLPADPGEVRAVPRNPRVQALGEELRTPAEWTLVLSDATSLLSAFSGDVAAYDRARRYLAAIEGRDPAGAFEGVTGPVPEAAARLSATRLERYGECPFQYFAAEVLRVFPYPDDEGSVVLAPQELGILAHAMLEVFFRRRATAARVAGDSGPDLESAVAAAGAAFEKASGVPLTGPRAVQRDRVARAVRAYVVWELGRPDGFRPTFFEARAAADFAGCALTGYLDRVDVSEDGRRLRVIDYKLRHRADFFTAKLGSQAARGKKLQAPLYVELAEALAKANGLPAAVAEAFEYRFLESFETDDPAVPEIFERRHRARLDRDAARKLAPEIEDAVRAFADSIRSGLFFLRPQEGPFGHCRRCDFAALCRKNHGALARRAQPDRLPASLAYWRVVLPRRAAAEAT